MSDDVDPNMINMASIRVRGVGGLGLVALAFIVASQFQMISGTLELGALGGLAGAAVVILWRRRHGPIGAASDGPGGRRFLWQNLDREDRDVSARTMDDAARDPRQVRHRRERHLAALDERPAGVRS